MTNQDLQSRKSISPPSRRKTDRFSHNRNPNHDPIAATSSFYSPDDSADIKIANQLSSQNIGKVIYMGLCFLVMYTGLCASNLIAEIYDQLKFNSLGQISSIVFYAVFAITALFSAKIMEGWSYKKSVFLGSVGYIFPLAAGVFTAQCEVVNGSQPPSFCGNLVIIHAANYAGNFINGISAAVLWIGVNQYVTACSNESNRGRYMGIFYGINAFSGVFGNLMSNRVIHALGKSSFFIVCTALVLLAVAMILFAPSVPKYEEENVAETVSEKCGKIFRLAANKRMVVFLPYLLYVGIVTAMYGGFEYRLVEDTISMEGVTENQEERENYKSSITALVLMVQSLVTVIISYTAGGLADYFSLSKVLNGFLATFFIGLGISFYAYETKNLIYTYIMAAIWGLSHSGSITLTGVVMLKDFDGSFESYALMELIMNTGTIFGNIFCIKIQDIKIFLYTVMALLVVTQFCSLFYRTRPAKTEDSETTPLMTDVESDSGLKP